MELPAIEHATFTMSVDVSNFGYFPVASISTVNNTSATTLNIDYACRIRIGSFGSNKIAQMVWLSFINGKYGQSTKGHRPLFAKRISSISS